MICEKCRGSGRPPSSKSRVEICDACGGTGHVADPPRNEDALPTNDEGLETTKAPHEIMNAMGHSNSPLENDGGH
jgi:hypothetical protein